MGTKLLLAIGISGFNSFTSISIALIISSLFNFVFVKGLNNKDDAALLSFTTVILYSFLVIAAEPEIFNMFSSSNCFFSFNFSAIDSNDVNAINVLFQKLIYHLKFG